MYVYTDTYVQARRWHDVYNMMSSTLEEIKLTKKDESQIAAGPACRKMTNNSSTSNKKNQMKTKKQYVWIVRNGLTKYPLVDGVCPFDSKYRREEIALLLLVEPGYICSWFWLL